MSVIFICIVFGRNSGKKRTHSNRTFFRCLVRVWCSAWLLLYIWCIFMMTLVNSAKNLVYLQNMYFFTCMMQKLPFSWSLYCWMLIIFGRIVWNLFMWNVYYMYLHLHFVHVQCICQQDCKVLLIYQHRVQERKKKDYIVFWWCCYFNVLY